MPPADTAASAPVAARRPTVRTVHGETLTDDHAWLRADNWREVLRDPGLLAADIRAHLEAENAYCEALLGAPTAALRKTLVAEMRARIKEDDASVPAPDGPFDYFVRHRDGGQHPLVCRRPRDGGDEDLMLDGDALAAGKTFFRLANWRWSPDHRRLAYAVDETGSEFDLLRVRDLATGTDLADAVPETSGGVVWQRDGAAFYYVRLDANHRPSRVYRHRLGTPAERDELVFEERDPGVFVSLDETQAQQLAVIGIGDHETSEARLLDLADPAATPRTVAPRETGVRYSVEHHPDGTLYILTNADGAEDFKIVTAPLATPARAHWRDVVPHRPGTMILGLLLLRDHLVRLEREDGLPRIVVRDLAGGEEHAIAFAEEAYSLGLDTVHEFATTTIRFTYSSPTTPAETWDYDLVTRTRVLRKRQEVPSGHDPADYVVRRLHAPAADGETVPVTVLYRAGTPLDGSAPCLLYGYGAYGISMPAAFNTGRLSLVDRGFVHAVAHVRGGTEKGWRWYRTGKLAHKPNSFGDFVAAARHLAAERFTAPGRIVAQGGSAGGMLMGAVANLAPELFAGIIGEVPFVDVLATMLDDTLPLTPPEWPEWGNPITDPAAFATIRGYSPVDNVAPRPYPAVLAMAGLTDPRVTYWEPAKWVARLRAATTSSRPVLLKMNMDAGHAGATGRFDRLEEVALGFAFALMVAPPSAG